METKANHLAIGSFVLASVVGLILFVLWLSKAEIDRKLDAYHIYFSGSVSGLSVASKVRYRGVPVGTVTAIGIDPDNSELVDVQISGGSKNSPQLVAKQGELLPVLASVPTKFEELLAGAPNLLARATLLIDRAMLMLSNENLIAFTQTLANVQQLTADISESSGALETLSNDVSDIAATIRATAIEIEGLVGEISERLPGMLDEASATLVSAEGALGAVNTSTRTLTGEATATLDQVRDTASSLADTAEQLTLLVAENRASLKDFSGEGLYELSRFLAEARELVAGLSRISDRFESDPSGFLFRGNEEGYTPQ